MNWTNDLELCLQVCNYNIPVMSAVWHTVDQSILDMVSCYDCKTPSEASKILIDIYNEFFNDLKNEFDYINKSIINLRDKYKNELFFISKNLPLMIWKKIRGYKQELQSFNIDSKIQYNLKIIKNTLDLVYSKITSNSPDKIIFKWYNLVFDKNGKVTHNYNVWEDYIMKSKNAQYNIRILNKNSI